MLFAGALVDNYWLILAEHIYKSVKIALAVLPDKAPSEAGEGAGVDIS